MPTSSARSDYAGWTAYKVDDEIGAAAGGGQVGENTRSLMRSGTSPSHAFPATARAAMWRDAGRKNALSTRPEEKDALMRESAELLAKEYEGNLSKRESHRLRLVLWHLDRIEDAEHGSDLDALEACITEYESYALRLASLEKEIPSRLPKAK